VNVRERWTCDHIRRILLTMTSQTSFKKKRHPSAKTPRLKTIGETWQLQSAKARFSEVFRLARTVGPQLITRQGKDGVVMLPVEQFEQLVARSRQPRLVEFFRQSPLVGVELDLKRDKDTGRDTEL
jgi:antitoxin Phd